MSFSSNNNLKQQWLIKPLTTDSMNPNQEVKEIRPKPVSHQKYSFFPEEGYEKNNTESNYYRASLGIEVNNPSNIQYNNAPEPTEPALPIIPQSFRSKNIKFVEFSSNA